MPEGSSVAFCSTKNIHALFLAVRPFFAQFVPLPVAFRITLAQFRAALFNQTNYNA
jgi:hypothetical protein